MKGLFLTVIDLCTIVLELKLCISNSGTCEFGEIRTKGTYFLGQVCGGHIGGAQQVGLECYPKA